MTNVRSIYSCFPDLSVHDSDSTVENVVTTATGKAMCKTVASVINDSNVSAKKVSIRTDQNNVSDDIVSALQRRDPRLTLGKQKAQLPTLLRTVSCNTQTPESLLVKQCSIKLATKIQDTVDPGNKVMTLKKTLSAKSGLEPMDTEKTDWWSSKIMLGKQKSQLPTLRRSISYSTQIKDTVEKKVLNPKKTLPVKSGLVPMDTEKTDRLSSKKTASLKKEAQSLLEYTITHIVKKTMNRIRMDKPGIADGEFLGMVWKYSLKRLDQIDSKKDQKELEKKVTAAMEEEYVHFLKPKESVEPGSSKEGVVLIESINIDDQKTGSLDESAGVIEDINIDDKEIGSLEENAILIEEISIDDKEVPNLNDSPKPKNSLTKKLKAFNQMISIDSAAIQTDSDNECFIHRKQLLEDLLLKKHELQIQNDNHCSTDDVNSKDSVNRKRFSPYGSNRKRHRSAGMDMSPGSRRFLSPLKDIAKCCSSPDLKTFSNPNTGKRSKSPDLMNMNNNFENINKIEKAAKKVQITEKIQDISSAGSSSEDRRLTKYAYHLLECNNSTCKHDLQVWKKRPDRCKKEDTNCAQDQCVDTDLVSTPLVTEMDYTGDNLFEDDDGICSNSLLQELVEHSEKLWSYDEKEFQESFEQKESDVKSRESTYTLSKQEHVINLDSVQPKSSTSLITKPVKDRAILSQPHNKTTPRKLATPENCHNPKHPHCASSSVRRHKSKYLWDSICTFISPSSESENLPFLTPQQEGQDSMSLSGEDSKKHLLTRKEDKFGNAPEMRQEEEVILVTGQEDKQENPPLKPKILFPSADNKIDESMNASDSCLPSLDASLDLATCHEDSNVAGVESSGNLGHCPCHEQKEDLKMVCRPDDENWSATIMSKYTYPPVEVRMCILL